MDWVAKEYLRWCKAGAWKKENTEDALKCWNLERVLDAELLQRMPTPPALTLEQLVAEEATTQPASSNETEDEVNEVDVWADHVWTNCLGWLSLENEHIHLKTVKCCCSQNPFLVNSNCRDFITAQGCELWLSQPFSKPKTLTLTLSTFFKAENAISDSLNFFQSQKC